MNGKKCWGNYKLAMFGEWEINSGAMAMAQCANRKYRIERGSNKLKFFTSGIILAFAFLGGNKFWHFSTGNNF
jgi:hypothetical protein